MFRDVEPFEPLRNSCSSSSWVFARLLPYVYFQSEAAMQITSNAIGGSAHFLSDHAEQAQHDATNPESALLRQGIIIVGGAPATEDKGKGVAGPTENLTLNFGQVSLAYAQQKANGTGVNPQPPATTSSSMASFVPSGGLHPIAGSPAMATAMHLDAGSISEAIGDAANAGLNLLKNILDVGGEQPRRPDDRPH